MAIRTILVHVDRVRARRFCLRIRVNLARSESANVVRTRTNISSGSREAQFFVLLCFRLVQELLVPLQTLGRCPSNDGSYRPPLSGHQFGQV